MVLHFIIILCVFTFPSTRALGTLQGSNLNATNNIAKPNCQTYCGNIAVPYPFGIGNDTGCSLNKSFYMTCNTSYERPKLFLQSRTHEVHSFSDSELRLFTSVDYKCYNKAGDISSEFSWWTDLGTLTAYTFSERNKFTVVGCDDIALINGLGGDGYSNGCLGVCSELFEADEGECSGKGCCQTSITKGLKYYNITLNTFNQHINVSEFSQCGYAFLGEEGSFRFGGPKDLYTESALDFYNRVTSSVPVVLDWVIAPEVRNCSNQANECKGKSHCYNVDGGGYRCRCNQGYEGNPYLDQGCEDINECDNKSNCYGLCKNTEGSYDCTCWPGYSGNATTPDGCRPDAKGSNFTTTIFTLGVVLGIGMLVLAICMYKLIRKRTEKKRREGFFRRNGGLLLQQQTLNGEHAAKTTRFFSAIELEKATDRYNRNRIVGRGGQGTVYKGMLPDGKIVAVKKSMLVDESQVGPFINEVFLLSQISHKNVVKLLGCCLETEVPILVYEFVSNGDLFQFIHDENYEFPSLWGMRLQIAREVAGALSYMHTATSVPVYHRDIKSSNILLDDKFRAKLSDFGISKSVFGDQTHLSTSVKGTFGYLDPEYFQSSQFTEKSYVYSFGVVLIELLTGKKPIYSIGPGESRSLATLILSTEEGLLMENVDNCVSDGPEEQLVAVAMLAKRCLNLNGTLRPTMKEVFIKLEGIRTND